MRSLIVLMIAFLQYTGVFAADNDQPKGAYCGLPVPPADAGEELNHDVQMRIYPRARDMRISYSGCQTMWVAKGNQWITKSVVAIERGQPVRIWSPDPADAKLMVCRYLNGRIVRGDVASCPNAQLLVMESLAPGCIDKVRKAMGAKAPRPAGCDYE